VTEKDVVASEAKTWTPKLRLTREQQDDKQALEDEIKFAKKELDEAGEDAEKKTRTAATVAAKQAELDALVAGFEARHARTRPAHAGQALERAVAPARPRYTPPAPRHVAARGVGVNPKPEASCQPRLGRMARYLRAACAAHAAAGHWASAGARHRRI
jgi:hypothetical protein